MTYQHVYQAGKTASAPLVFAFHGTGGDEHQFPGLIQQILPDAAIVSPRGDVSEHGAARFFRRTGEGVYDMDDLAQRTGAMAEFIAAQVARHPGVPVYGLGYSNGANILASVLLQQGLRFFDSAVLMHPLIPWQPQPQPALHGVNILITAGQNDPICPFPLTQKLDAYFNAQGAQSQLYAHSGGHEIQQSELQAVAAFMRA